MTFSTLSDLSQSLKFHISCGIDVDRGGGIYVNLNNNNWQIASIEDRNAKKWRLENIEISDNISEIDPITIFLDKSSAQSFISFIDSQSKNSQTYTIDVENNTLLVNTEIGKYELLIENNKFPDFNFDLKTFIKIDQETWSLIKQLSDYINPNIYQKSIYGVFVDSNGTLYSTDTSNIFAIKTNKSFEKSFFIPKEFISNKISPSEVEIKHGQDIVFICMDNIKYIINNNIDGNLITNNTFFPIEEISDLVSSYPDEYNILWSITKNGLTSIIDLFSQFDILNLDENNFNVKIFDKNNKCKYVATSKKYKVETEIETSNIHKNKYVIYPHKKSIGIFRPISNFILKNKLELSCDIGVSVGSSSIIGISAKNISDTIKEIIAITNHVSYSQS